MTQILAKNLIIGTQYKSGSTIQEVVKIVKVSDKAIEFRTKRISPTNSGDMVFFQRKRLNTTLQTF